MAGLALAALVPAPARAVLIAGPDGSINVTPPLPDPGFDHVGRIGGLSGVYVGRGWVLTAGHVGESPIELAGEVYEPVAGSLVRFADGTGEVADLAAFKLMRRPPLLDLALASVPPSVGEEVVLIGQGRNRGAPTSWGGAEGWEWDTGRAMRWGTNRISLVDDVELGTRCFDTTFDQLGGRLRDEPEAQAVPGDSGGAVFVLRGATAELAGILFAQGLRQDQPASTTLFGNSSYAADLFVYRDAILQTVEQPDCDDGLDEDGDGRVDFPDDPGCASASDDSERSAALVCDNGLDDDGDGMIDFPSDPGCEDLLDPFEVPEPAIASALAVGAAFVGGLGRRRAPWQAHRRSLGSGSLARPRRS